MTMTLDPHGDMTHETGPGDDHGTSLPIPQGTAGTLGPDSQVWRDRELNRLLEKWQRRLCLQHWDIKVRYARAHETNDGQEVQGHVRWVIEKRAAVIRITSPIDRDPDIPWDLDIERVLVHELGHLVMAYLPQPEAGTVHDVMHENAINVYTEALLASERGTKVGPAEPH
jgi:hypothetical protein